MKMTTQEVPPQDLHYAASLDPWLRPSTKEVEWFIKLSALTSKHVVVSDNQVINNRGLQRLLRRPDALEFLFTPENDGVTPLVVSLREGVDDMYDVLSKVVLDREIPPIFPWMSNEQQKRLDLARAKGSLKTLGHFFDIAGEEFVTHIDTLNYRIGNLPIVRWHGLEESYPTLVMIAISKFVTALKKEERSDFSVSEREALLGVCDKMVQYIQLQGSKANRSNLFRIIASSQLRVAIQKTLVLKLLDEPYHLNFAKQSGYNMITGVEYRKAVIGNLLSDIAINIQSLRPEEIIEIDEFPVLLHQVPFKRIHEIRNLYSFKHLMDALTRGSDESRVYVLRDILNLINAELSKEPKGFGKLNKLRLSVLLPPRQLRDQLAEAGISFSDVIAILGKGGGFLAGEAAGQLVGVFGVGGLVGTGIAVVVEQLVDHAILKPKRKQEFQNIVQLLIASKTQQD